MPALVESYQIAERIGDKRLTLTATFWMTSGMIDRDPRGAIEHMESVIEAARKYRRRDIEAHALGKKAVAHARLGEFAEARDALERANEATRKTESVVNGADVAMYSSLTFLDMGDAQRGLEYSQRGTEQALSAGGLECAMYGRYCTGLGNLHARNLPEAQKAFEASLKLLTDNLFKIQGSEQLVNDVRAGLAIAQFFGGRSEAINAMERTMANAEAIGDDYMVAFVAQALGEGYTRFGDFERAEQYLNTALDYYRRNDMRPYLARALQALAYWYEEQGRGAEAQQPRAEARQLMEDLSLPPVRLLSSLRPAPDRPQPTGPADS
jgi:tetratricopeptide (TPR) repeat protein